MDKFELIQPKHAAHDQSGAICDPFDISSRTCRTAGVIAAGLGKGLIDTTEDKLLHHALPTCGQLALDGLAGAALGAFCVAQPEIALPLGVALTLNYAKQQLLPDDPETKLRNQKIGHAVRHAWESSLATNTDSKIIADNLGATTFDFVAGGLTCGFGFAKGRTLAGMLAKQQLPGMVGNIWAAWPQDSLAAPQRPATPSLLSQLDTISKQLRVQEREAALTKPSPPREQLCPASERLNEVVQSTNISPQFEEEMTNALKFQIPAEDVQRISDAGFKICLSKNVVEYDPVLAETRPRGYLEGDTFKTCNGFAEITKKNIVLFEHVHDQDGNWIKSSNMRNMAAVLKHEIGHALAAINKWESDPKIIAAYEEAREDVLEDPTLAKSLSYYLQPDRHLPVGEYSEPVEAQAKIDRPGLSETVAELYAIKQGGGASNQIGGPLHRNFERILHLMDND